MRRALMIGAAAALVGGSLAMAEPAAAAGTVTVTPSTGLVDLDTVDVVASGFTPNQTIGVCQGVDDPPAGVEDCIRPPGLFQADAEGGLHLELTVRRFGFQDGHSVDCLDPANACVIGVAEFPNIANTVVNTPISFAPPPPPPSERGTVEVTPDEMLDEQAVEVVGTGFRPGATVEVMQCVAAPADPTDCSEDFDVTVEADGAGGFVTELFVTSQIGPFGQSNANCALAPGACVVAAAEVVDVPGTIVSAPLSFVLRQPDLQVIRLGDDVVFFDDIYPPTLQVKRHAICGNWSWALVAQNDGNVADEIQLSAVPDESTEFDVKYFLAWYDVTEAVTNGEMVLRLAPGESLPFNVQFTSAPDVPIGRELSIQVNLFSQAAPQHADSVDLEVTVAAPTPTTRCSLF